VLAGAPVGACLDGPRGSFDPRVPAEIVPRRRGFGCSQVLSDLQHDTGGGTAIIVIRCAVKPCADPVHWGKAKSDSLAETDA
jgi:hypothetical protein